MKNGKIITILLISTIIFTIIGGTFAYYTWQTSEQERTDVSFTAEANFSCSADIGGTISSGDTYLMPDDCTGTHAIKRTLTVTPKINGTKFIYMDLWLNINEIGEGLTSSNNFKYAVTTSSTSCTTGVISSGTFTGKKQGNKVYLLDSKKYTSNTLETYYLYVWLDKEETSNTTQNQSFSLSLNGECTDDTKPYSESILNGAAPELDAGMIPVVIDNSGTSTTVKTIDKSSPEWYSYENKQWANVILTTETSRNKYLNTSGILVSEDDILAYYVWIPRYKYKIWTTTESGVGKEQTIDIVFERKTTTKSNGTAVNDYITHPAFTFGDTELNGIWVGKFETSTDTSSDCYKNRTSNSCNNSNQEPRIKPNVKSLNRQAISNQFETAKKFGTSTYGITLKTNAHMMKNSEWGAVAYLSHSIYGINQEIYINNSSDGYTGRSGGNVSGNVNIVSDHYSGESSTKQYISNGYYTWDGKEIDSTGTIGTYASDRTLGTKASTTGNITGIYDMAGGSYEYVMGYYSGASETWGGISNGNNYAGFSSKPDSMYYDDYPTTNALTACSDGICYGHALSETSTWYNDMHYYIYNNEPWIRRGSNYDSDSTHKVAGIFAFGRYNGSAAEFSFRSVLSIIS